MEDLVLYNSRSFCYVLGCIFGHPQMLDLEKEVVIIYNLRNITRLLDALYENHLEFSDNHSMYGDTTIVVHDSALFNYIKSIRHDSWCDYPPIIKMYDTAHKLDFLEGLEDDKYPKKRVAELKMKLLMQFPEMLDH